MKLSELSESDREAVAMVPRAALGLAMFEYVLSRGKVGSTCDECLRAIDISHQKGNGPFYAVARSGCLVRNGKSRKTQTGGQGVVFVANPDATLAMLLRPVQQIPRSRSSISARDQAILAAGLRFLKAWGKAKTGKRQQEAITSLVKEILSASP